MKIAQYCSHIHAAFSKRQRELTLSDTQGAVNAQVHIASRGIIRRRVVIRPLGQPNVTADTERLEKNIQHDRRYREPNSDRLQIMRIHLPFHLK